MKDSESPPVKLAGAAGAAESPKGRRAYKIAVLVLAVLLVGSLSLNASLVGLSESYFRRELLVRLDPAGLKAYATDRAKPPASGPVLLFFGDSRAFMWPEPNTPTGYRILNHGISYQTTEQILLRIEEDAVSVHPSVVVLEGGVNDLKTIAELPEQRAQIVADCEANLARIVDRCRQAGATVVLVSVFDIGNVSIWKRPFWSHDVEAAVREVNAFLVGLVGPHVVLFDANRILDDSPGHIAPEYQMDYLHLIPAGYAALNGKLVPLLASLPK